MFLFPHFTSQFTFISHLSPHYTTIIALWTFDGLCLGKCVGLSFFESLFSFFRRITGKAKQNSENLVLKYSFLVLKFGIISIPHCLGKISREIYTHLNEQTQEKKNMRLKWCL